LNDNELKAYDIKI